MLPLRPSNATSRPPLGADKLDDGTKILVTVADGQHVGRHAKALFRGCHAPWLRA